MNCDHDSLCHPETPPEDSCQSSLCQRPVDQSEALLARGGSRGGGGVGCDGVERDVAVVRLLTVAARHPGVKEDLLQGWSVGWLLAQTPANQLLALCDRNTRR